LGIYFFLEGLPSGSRKKGKSRRISPVQQHLNKISEAMARPDCQVHASM